MPKVTKTLLRELIIPQIIPFDINKKKHLLQDAFLKYMIRRLFLLSSLCVKDSNCCKVYDFIYARTHLKNVYRLF